MDRGDLFIVALLILLPAGALWAIFLSRSTRARKPAAILGIPLALRPGQPDERLEGSRLNTILVAGVLSSVALAVFIPAYWLPEASRQEAFQERFDEEAVHRGALIYDQAPELEEDTPASEFKDIEEAIALGQGCILCHGPKGAGGLASTAGGEPGYIDPITDRQVQYVAPPLNNVFTRWDDEIVEFTIKRGRPGTPMPTWGVLYGGSMTDQMVSDVMAYLKSLPQNQQAPEIPENCADPEPLGGANTLSCGKVIFDARCAVCHGPKGQGKDGEGTSEDPWYQGMALWKGEVTTLTTAQHLQTVRDGRRFAFMPAFAEAPSQGIPIPPFPLTDSQIQAVIQYERSL